MDKYLKLVPFGLMLAFGIQGLLIGFSWPMMAAFAVLGLTAFLLEKHTDKKEIALLRTESVENKKEINDMKRDLETTKAFVTGMKLNGLQGLRQNGLNRTAQQ